MLYFCYFSSPIGKLLLSGDKQCLWGISLPIGNKVRCPNKDWQECPSIFNAAKEQLTAYFDRQSVKFTLPIKLAISDFQLKVLKAVQKIPYGKTLSYSDIAKEIGNPKAARAVGKANATNPLPLIIPCHRVVGKKGDLVGYCGGQDTSMKKFLLKLENGY